MSSVSAYSKLNLFLEFTIKFYQQKKTNNDYNLVVTLSTSVKFCCSASQETETELFVGAGAGTFSRKEVILLLPKGEEPLSFSFS